MSESLDLELPALVERTHTVVDGQRGERLMFIFRAIGCSYALRPDGGCSNCGFLPLSSQGAPVRADQLIAQFDSVFDQPAVLDGVVEVDLFNSGSFFADNEMPAAAREHVLRRLGSSEVRRVLVESRPEFIQSGRVGAACALVADGRLEVGIGLESADDRVREQLVNKGFDRPAFERACRVLAEHDVRLLAYLLVKPLGLDEGEAVDDAEASCRYVFELAERLGLRAHVALQPVFVAPRTALERAFEQGRYQPPSLWSVIEVLRRVRGLGEVTVGTSDEGLGPRRAARGCDDCTPALLDAFATFNAQRDLTVFDPLGCICQDARATT